MKTYLLQLEQNTYNDYINGNIEIKKQINEVIDTLKTNDIIAVVVPKIEVIDITNAKTLAVQIHVGDLPIKKINEYFEKIRCEFQNITSEKEVIFMAYNDKQKNEIIEIDENKRHVWYIDVGDLPTHKAVEYIENIKNEIKNKAKNDIFLPKTKNINYEIITLD